MSLRTRDAEDDPTHAAAEREAARLVRVITRKVLDSRQNLTDLPIESLDELVSFRQAGTWLLKRLLSPAVHGNLVKEQNAKTMVISAREVVLAVFGGRMDESRPSGVSFPNYYRPRRCRGRKIAVGTYP
jgi:hypothetical protein